MQTPPQLLGASIHGQRITRTIEWLNQHFDQPMRIEDLAREVNLSTSTLHHRFKAVTALSPCNIRSNYAYRKRGA